VEERAGFWVFAEGGLRVAKTTQRTLVCVELDDEAGAPARGQEAVDEKEDEVGAGTVSLLRCGVDGCGFQNKHKWYLVQHQARVHGIGDVKTAEERIRKQREWAARQPAQRCGFDGCEFQTKHNRDLKQHEAAVHGHGDVDMEELRRKKRESKARQTAQRCGVDGCEFQAKQKSDLKQHQARVHGIGDVDAEELRRKKREWQARQPAQRCGVDGCEYVVSASEASAKRVSGSGVPTSMRIDASTNRRERADASAELCSHQPTLAPDQSR
jgi:hypothetical protein